MIALPAMVVAQVDDMVIENDQLIYEQPSFKKLSQLFVTLNRVDLNDDDVIREYLEINECEIVQKFLHNEFEWAGISGATREHLKNNRTNLSTRFEVIQRLNLANYDFEKQGFNIDEEFIVDGMRLFEILASDFGKRVCGRLIYKHFSQAVVAELSRPFSYDFLPLEKERAQKLLAKKGTKSPFHKKQTMNLEDVYETRDVYIGLNIKFFASQGTLRVAEGGRRAKFLAVLEGYKVYSDKNKTEILEEKTFRSQQGSRKISQSLSEQIEALKKERAQWAEEKRAEEEALEREFNDAPSE